MVKPKRFQGQINLFLYDHNVESDFCDEKLRIKVQLGRGFGNRSSENPGIAKIGLIIWVE